MANVMYILYKFRCNEKRKSNREEPRKKPWSKTSHDL